MLEFQGVIKMLCQGPHRMCTKQHGAHTHECLWTGHRDERCGQRGAWASLRRAAVTHLQLILPCDFTGQGLPNHPAFQETRDLPSNVKCPELENLKTEEI